MSEQTQPITDSKWTCSICLSTDGYPMVLTPCGHSAICDKCTLKDKTCPICRSNVSTIIPNYEFGASLGKTFVVDNIVNIETSCQIDNNEDDNNENNHENNDDNHTNLFDNNCLIIIIIICLIFFFGYKH